MNKSILDQGWYEFHRLLQYKLDWQGGSLVEVDYRNTSQRCSCCGHTENADVNRSVAELGEANAAVNILTGGQAGMVYVANRINDRQQKPARNREGVLSQAS